MLTKMIHKYTTKKKRKKERKKEYEYTWHAPKKYMDIYVDHIYFR